MAENILAAACESETRNAAKRMRLDVYQPAVSRLPAAPRTGLPTGVNVPVITDKVHRSQLLVLGLLTKSEGRTFFE